MRKTSVSVLYCLWSMENSQSGFAKKYNWNIQIYEKNIICCYGSFGKFCYQITSSRYSVQSQMINDVQQTVRLGSQRVWFAVKILSRLSVHQPGYMAAVADARLSISHWQCGKNGSGATFSDYHVLDHSRWRTLLEQLANNDILYHNSSNVNSWKIYISHFILKM